MKALACPGHSPTVGLHSASRGLNRASLPLPHCPVRAPRHPRKCLLGVKCNAQQPQQPGEQQPQQPQQPLVIGETGSSSSSSHIQPAPAVTPSEQPQQPQQQIGQQPIQQGPTPPPPQPKQQQQQQQKASSPQQQQHASKQQPSRKPHRNKQQQQPFFLFRWLQSLLTGLRNLQSTLATFLVGGCGAALLLYSWARGSPLRRAQPYRFTMTFAEASKLDAGTPVRMKGVQIGNVTRVTLHPSHVDAVAEVADAANIIPQGSRVDINLLGLAADAWIDITPPANAVVRKDHGPHHPLCSADGLIVCHNGNITGHQGGSTDFMMKFFLSQHDRTRVKTVEDIYHGKHI